MKFLKLISLLFLLFSAPAYADEEFPDFLKDPQTTDPDFPPRMWSFSIDSEGSEINGFTYIANGEGPHPTAILLYGFPGNEKSLDLAQSIRRAGWNAVFFNFRGAWGSGGTYSVENANQDVTNVIQYLISPENATDMRVDPNAIALIGHSFGGFKAFYGAVNNPEVACAVGLSPSDIGHHMREVEAGKRTFWPWVREMAILKGYTREIAVEEFTRNRDAFYVMDYGLKLTDIPVLIVTPDGDGKSNVARQFATAEKFKEEGVNITHALIDNADHPFSSKRIELMRIVTHWLNGPCLAKIK